MLQSEPSLGTAPSGRAECARRHGFRQFMSPGSEYRPPLLWTFPGAGNTWVRLLLEYATGTYTGSVYGDPSLLPLLPGEGHCDDRVVAVKAHPTHIDSFDLVPAEPHVRHASHAALFRMNVSRKPQYLKCAPLRFRGAIVVVRDPFKSIWAEYKRYTNWREVIAGRSAEASKSLECRMALHRQPLHSGALLRSCFDANDWHK